MDSLMGHFFKLNYGGSWLLMIGASLVRVAIVVGVVILIVKIINNNSHPSHKKHYNEQLSTPIDILKERYAKGEIDEEEYQHKLKMLRQ